MEHRKAKFHIGQVVRHRVYPFRGIVFDVDRPQYVPLLLPNDLPALRKVAADDLENLGDTSTLLDPSVVEAIKEGKAI